ncbi:Beta-barrel assembly-enhancing protease [Paraglaciecola mesophila]|uniref:Beta-barrel assembly-enhancing protease n=1 Tax=Paraglaciecola mesophila TaxID=197222 RepID=A0A857JNE1_9ALTE|nr:tetratricopeptide repeat protein [Paraglaciecola mesophila]QHJ12531.1 Beta-barrel assembly-enhancing protease [Paraglaciecola mesophila]
MSVVNKMLQDLEARQSASESVSADYQPPKRNVGKLAWIVLLLLTVVLIVLGGYYWSVLNSDTSNQITNKPVASALLEDEDAVSAQAQKPTSDTLANGSAPQKVVWIEPDAPAPTSAIAETTNTQNVSSEKQTSHTQNTSTKPDNTAESLLTDPETPRLASAKQADSGSNEQPKAVFSKQTNHTRYAEAGLKQTINQALRDGKTLIAISGLQKLLSTDPNNLRIRKKLASLLFAENRLQEAQALLTEGVASQPEQHDLRLMLARLFAQQDNPSKALSLLLEVSPSLVLHSDYYAYRGALAQQMENYAQAQQDYQKLVNAEPQQAKWWLGLGIAQDSSGDKTQALVSYQKADNEQQLTPQVIRFVRQRLNDLVGIE